MSAEEAALVMVIAVHGLGAMPEVPPVTGPGTWFLRWIHDAAQGIARNFDKLHGRGGDK